MQQKLTIGTKLLGGVAAMLTCTAILGSCWLTSVSSMQSQFEEVIDKTSQKAQLASDIAVAQATMVSAQRGVILAAYSKDKAELAQYETEFRQNAEATRKALETMTPLLVTPEGHQLTADLSSRLAGWLPAFESIAHEAESDNGDAAEHIRTSIVVPMSQKMSAEATRLAQLQNELLQEAKQGVNARVSGNRTTALTLLVVSVLLCTGIFFVVRDVNLSLRRAFAGLMNGAREFASTAHQVSSSSQSLAQGSSEQAASLEEMSASGREINSVALRNQAGSQSAAELVTTSERKFADANRVLEEMIAAMSEINSSSEKISKIIRVIDEIAFQTNILALNAAVEAARAGEAGMGFAVVADEVRNLAQRSATAARDTANLIEGSITASHAGSKKVNDVASAIREIAEESTKVKALVDQVNLGSQEQARGLEVMARSLIQVEQVTQSAAASAEESAAAAQELTSQSESLRTVVLELTSMVGGGEEESGHRPAYRRPVHATR